jgi:hypothetical protein
MHVLLSVCTMRETLSQHGSRLGEFVVARGDVAGAIGGTGAVE